jgi:uncharacterized membrane protein
MDPVARTLVVCSYLVHYLHVHGHEHEIKAQQSTRNIMPFRIVYFDYLHILIATICVGFFAQ